MIIFCLLKTQLAQCNIIHYSPLPSQYIQLHLEFEVIPSTHETEEKKLRVPDLYDLGVLRVNKNKHIEQQDPGLCVCST
jgi:hypothetical protein